MIWTGDSPEDQTLALPITIKWVGFDGEINVLRIKEAAEPVSPRLLLEMICADFWPARTGTTETPKRCCSR
jgi:hypothetical protein